MSLLDVLFGLGTPPEPRDGDCLAWAPRVTDALVADGLDATTVWVVGSVKVGALDAILFTHMATRVANLIIDTTARQFHPDFPLRWVAEEPQYVARVLELTGAAKVVISERQVQP